MYNLFLVLCIPCFLYLLMRGGLQLLLGDQSVGESGIMDIDNQTDGTTLFMNYYVYVQTFSRDEYILCVV